jgi:hypothetical protein
LGEGQGGGQNGRYPLHPLWLVIWVGGGTVKGSDFMVLKKEIHPLIQPWPVSKFL